VLYGVAFVTSRFLTAKQSGGVTSAGVQAPVGVR
jgi:hypothetical protein